MKRRYVLKRLFRDITKPIQARRQSPVDAPREGFEMISARNEVNPTLLPKPEFELGQKVNYYNPYHHTIFSILDDEFAMAGYEEEAEFEPTFHEITAIWFDPEDAVYRYELDNNFNEWVSEEWLTHPLVTEFIKYQPGERTPELDEAERAILHKALDDEARQGEINRMLDILNNGTKAEREYARQRLKELTRGV